MLATVATTYEDNIFLISSGGLGRRPEPVLKSSNLLKIFGSSDVPQNFLVLFSYKKNGERIVIKKETTESFFSKIHQPQLFKKRQS